MSARRFLAPEVIQTSTMDCGPASLKCLLEGFGIPASFGRLREACQTSVDGTSIDTLEEVAGQLGLQAEQVVLPVDHALLPETDSFPAVAVLKVPSGGTHFVVLWRRHGPFLQVMDPASGRRWVRAAEFERELYVHGLRVPAGQFRGWAGTPAFRAGFLRRLRELGITEAAGDALLADALADATAAGVARLDAAARMVSSVVEAGGLRRGAESHGALRSICQGGEGAIEIPPTFWTAWPLPETDGQEVFLRGAVLVSARKGDGAVTETTRAPELTAALTERPPHPLAALARLLREDGLVSPLVLIRALALAAGGTVVQAVLMRALFDAREYLVPGIERAGAVLAVVALLLGLAVLEVPLGAGLARLGRHLEVRLRAAYLDKLSRLGDRYFGSRLASDMAERGHALHLVRRLPDVGARLLRSLFALVLTTLGIVWLSPSSGPIAAVIALAAVAVPLCFGPLLAERHLRFRTHQGALTRFYLDALIGIIPIRAHNAERTVRREHEGLLVDWVRAGYSVQRASMIVDGVVALSALALATWLLARHLGTGLEAGSALLLVYWTLQLPALGEEVAATVRMYPALRGVTMRLLELLGAPEESRALQRTPASATARIGVSIAFEGVTARAGGHEVLRGIDLRVGPAEHVAIVGPSGAGKSSLMGVLLGWLTPAEGRVLVDGVALGPAGLNALRQATAWLDPAVYLWNRSLLDNVLYGAPPGAVSSMSEILGASDLRRIIPHLPEGLQTELGEAGALLSGGEGQRVRLARALTRDEARLAILDEPFRGLDRGQRQALLEGARSRWRSATLFCVTHDLDETRGFDRVLVIDGGTLVEDGAPGALLARPGSRYRSLMKAEEQVRERLWSQQTFRRVRLEAGTLREEPPS